MAEPDRQPMGEPVPGVAGEPMTNSAPPPPDSMVSIGEGPAIALDAPVAQRGFPAWTGWDVLAILGATVFTIFACSGVGLWIGHSLPAFRHLSITALAQNPLIIVGSQIASYPIVIGLMAIIIRNRSGQRFLPAIRWQWPGRTATWFYVLGSVLAFSIEGLSHFLPIPKSLPMDKFFNDATSAYLMAFFGIAVAPLLEEFFFRGMLYPILRRGLGVLIGVVLTAAAFAAIHGAQLGYDWAAILSIFLVGLALTLLRQFTDSVAACVLTHSGYNFTLFALLWAGSDHFHHLEKLTG